MDALRLVVFACLLCLPIAMAWAAGREVRQPVIAGTWYQGTREGLARQVDGFLARVPRIEAPGRVVAIISPHAGFVYSGQTAAHGYSLLREQKAHRVILMGPSHREPLRGASIPVADAFLTPLGEVPLDREVCDALVKSGAFAKDLHNQREEHSLEIQLPFLQRVLGEFLLVPIMVGTIHRSDAARFADALRAYLDETTVLVASSDFTHYGRGYGYVPFTRNVAENLSILDGGAIERILARDANGFADYVEQTGTTICGALPIEILVRCLPDRAEGRQLHYSRSADTTGDYSMSVSYVSIAFFVRE